MDTIRRIALTLVIIGALNWGLIGLFQFDLVAALFGGQEAGFSRVIYTLVGIGALFCIPLLFAPVEEENKGAQRGQNLAYSTEFAEENDPSEFNNDKEN
ncbi:DUF378 domain-containing protein [Gracilibacillus saliphilus]|uniref:DUF378 domain-containing protein n=1 Tax=Gracilibacillus saliphilus TaxID=543890 RepID=UPI0013CF5B1F|nr:DUF378 domain-containing protein [Gracilibacillus saliphilus]